MPNKYTTMIRVKIYPKKSKDMSVLSIPTLLPINRKARYEKGGGVKKTLASKEKLEGKQKVGKKP